MIDPDTGETLADKIRRGDELSAEEVMAVFKTADKAGMLYYKMLTMVRERRSLSKLPKTLKEIIATDAWKSWRWVGSDFHSTSLTSYLTSPPPNGVGIDLDTVEKLVADDPDALSAYRSETTNGPGRQVGSQVPNNNNIINRNNPVQGTSLAYTLDRLERNHPELFDLVKAGELSANAAAIKAGFRKQKTTLEKLQRLWSLATDEEREQFMQAVQR